MKHKLLKTATLPLLLILLASCGITAPLLPYGPTPTPQQLQWQKREYYMFVHFGPNTFTDKEWGDGQEDPNVFNPVALDCEQWVRTAIAADMKGIILTAKHHDGFCLWPSKYSKHTVRESSWRDGKGDVLRELSEACKRHGLDFGVYVSPWDRNHPDYGTPQYNEVFAGTLNEVLSQYGPVFEQWLDGANGDADKGQLRQIYDWPLFHRTIYANQPDIVIFSDVGPGCRWVGNERGVASETNWGRLNIAGFEPGKGAPPVDTLQRGNIYGNAWVPVETDISIRPGWFYSASTDNEVKTGRQLMDIYYTSVGRNSNLLLNVPPNREGRISPIDSISLMEFKKERDMAFADNFLRYGEFKASSVRRPHKAHAAQNVNSSDYDSFWCPMDNDASPSIEINLREEKEFNCIVLQEYITLGQRISGFAIDNWDAANGQWTQIAEGTTIGYKRILRFAPAKGSKIRLRITSSLASPIINRVGLFNVS
ncbi:MAG: alpha-L-fucosidase [Tannerellaceae bacterium]|jgi:alpha-L-fucosidase|nr:alpha-L-fucosidase [Tannerellaceae bacterium]